MQPQLLVSAALLVLAPSAALAASATARHGTAVDWYADPAQARKVALETGRLLLVLHLTGDFRDASKTCRPAEALRSGPLSDPVVALLLGESFVATQRTTGTLTRILNGRRIVKGPGEVVVYFCTPAGRVVHAVSGAVSPITFAQEAAWALQLHQRVSRLGPQAGKELVATAHRRAARQRSGVRVVERPRATELGKRLIPLGAKSKGAISTATRRALEHQWLARLALEPLERAWPTLWGRVLGQKAAVIPVVDLRLPPLRIRCRIPLRKLRGCGLRRMRGADLQRLRLRLRKRLRLLRRKKPVCILRTPRER